MPDPPLDREVGCAGVAGRVEGTSEYCFHAVAWHTGVLDWVTSNSSASGKISSNSMIQTSGKLQGERYATGNPEPPRADQ